MASYTHNICINIHNIYIRLPFPTFSLTRDSHSHRERHILYYFKYIYIYIRNYMCVLVL